MVMAPILVFPNWSKIFHVHVDSTTIALGTCWHSQGNTCYTTQGNFLEKNCNYTTMKCKGPVMEYMLQISSIIFWTSPSSCPLIIQWSSIWLTIQCWKVDSIDVCYYFRILILKWWLNQVNKMWDLITSRKYTIGTMMGQLIKC